MHSSLGGLRVLVTGGASGIGQCIAETFAAAGSRVMICDVVQANIDAFKARNPEARTFVCDVSDEQQVDAMFAQIDGLDVMVNNAGITGPFGKIEDLQTADWVKTIDVNVHGIFYCMRHAAPMLKAAGGGSVINISSIAGRMGYAMRTPYSASKFAVIGLTKSLSIELGTSNIRVNALLPGYVAGPRHERNARERAKLLGITYEEQKARVMSRIALRQLTTPQDVATTAVFLASSLGAHITGQSISVDGNVETFGA